MRYHITKQAHHSWRSFPLFIYALNIAVRIVSLSARSLACYSLADVSPVSLSDGLSDVDLFVHREARVKLVTEHFALCQRKVGQGCKQKNVVQFEWGWVAVFWIACVAAFLVVCIVFLYQFPLLRCCGRDYV